MSTTLGDTTSSSNNSTNNIFSSSSSSSSVFPIPFLPIPYRCVSSSSRIRQRYYRVRLSTSIINCIIHSLNNLYSPLYYKKETFSSYSFSSSSSSSFSFSSSAFETANSTSFSNSNSNNYNFNSNSNSNIVFVPSRIHQRILDCIFISVRTFINESRGVSSLSGNASDIRDRFFSSSSSFPLYSIYQVISSTTDSFHSHSEDSAPTIFSPSSFPPSSFSFSSSLASPQSQSQSQSQSFPFSPSSSYFHSLPVAITPLIASSVSLPINTTSVNMLTVLPSEWSSIYATATSGLLKPIDIIKRDLFKFKLPKPSINGSKKEYISLIHRLVNNEMINFSLPSKIKVVNGLFTVTKDSTSTRMIVDARYANAHFIDPPSVHLPTPSSFISLSLPHGSTLYKCKTDLENFYHHIRLPDWLSEYFALPSILISQLPSEYVLSSPYLSSLPLSTRIHPVLTRLAMGFSHAVAIAQTIHENILYKSGALLSSSHILNLSCPVITSEPIHAPYVDDNNILGTDPIQLKYAYDKCIIAYADAGFPVKKSKCVLPTSDSVTMIGVSISSTGVISLPIDSIHNLMNATIYLLTIGHCTGKLLASIIGSWTWGMLLRRFSLCIFRHVYRFISCAGDKEYILWPSVINELINIISIVPLLRADMSCMFFDKVIATDASTTGAGMSATSINDNIFSSLFPFTGLHVHDLSSTYSISTDTVTTITSSGITSVVTNLFQPHIQSRTSSIDIVSSTLDAYNKISSTFWYDVFSFPWSRSDHINKLELNTVHTAIRWVLSHPFSISVRLLLCIDNAASYYALRKGRSTKLLSTLRKIAALILVSGLSLSLLWVPSKINPADKASRVYSNINNRNV